MKKILIVDDSFRDHEDIIESLQKILNLQTRKGICEMDVYKLDKLQGLYGNRTKDQDYPKIDGLSSVEVVQVFSFDGFHKAWEEEQKPDLVFMDGCVESSHIDTIPLIEEIRKTSNVYIIAMSTSSKFNEYMVNAGANYESPKRPEGFPKNTLEKIKEILSVCP